MDFDFGKISDETLIEKYKMLLEVQNNDLRFLWKAEDRNKYSKDFIETEWFLFINIKHLLQFVYDELCRRGLVEGVLPKDMDQPNQPLSAITKEISDEYFFEYYDFAKAELEATVMLMEKNPTFEILMDNITLCSSMGDIEKEFTRRKKHQAREKNKTKKKPAG